MPVLQPQKHLRTFVKRAKLGDVTQFKAQYVCTICEVLCGRFGIPTLRGFGTYLTHKHCWICSPWLSTLSHGTLQTKSNARQTTEVSLNQVVRSPKHLSHAWQKLKQFCFTQNLPPFVCSGGIVNKMKRTLKRTKSVLLETQQHVRDLCLWVDTTWQNSRWNIRRLESLASIAVYVVVRVLGCREIQTGLSFVLT